MNTEVQKTKQPESICFVTNIVDHRSISATTLLHITMKELGMESHLVDVRDVIPEADLYIWINTGMDRDLRNFLPLQSQCANIHGERINTKTMVERSIFVTATSTSGEDISSTLVGALLQRLKEITEMSEEDYVKLDALFWIVNAHSATWAACTGGEIEEVSVYHNYLQSCYRNYKRPYLTTEKIKEILSSKDTSEYLDLNQRMNETFSKRVQMTTVLGDKAVYFTFIDEEVYAVLRRIVSSKHRFYHLSEGLYGPVAFTNIEHVVKLGDRPTLVLHSV